MLWVARLTRNTLGKALFLGHLRAGCGPRTNSRFMHIYQQMAVRASKGTWYDVVV